MILLTLISLVMVGCTRKAHPDEKFVPAQTSSKATSVTLEEGTVHPPASTKSTSTSPAQTAGRPSAPTATSQPAGATTTPVIVPSPTPTENIPLISYRVRPGDTLFSIAQRFGTTSQWLRDYNHLLSNNIAVGQELLVPEPKEPIPTPTPLPKTMKYVVQPGDSLSSIAVRFGTTVDELIQLNHLSTETIQVGMVLKVPQGSNSPSVPAASYQTYVVRQGDTLIGLAEQFNTTVGELRSLNELTSDILVAGQALRVPASPSTCITYVVKQGDTLSSISQAYDVFPEEIARANNLSNEDLLVVGQTLRMPSITPTPHSARYHVVRAGETLISIAQKYGITVAQIQAANGINDSDAIYAGQRLLIP